LAPVTGHNVTQRANAVSAQRSQNAGCRYATSCHPFDLQAEGHRFDPGTLHSSQSSQFATKPSNSTTFLNLQPATAQSSSTPFETLNAESEQDHATPAGSRQGLRGFDGGAQFETDVRSIICALEEQARNNSADPRLSQSKLAELAQGRRPGFEVCGSGSSTSRASRTT
jgi:hypothetical protein